MQTTDDPPSRQSKTIFTVASLFMSVAGVWGMSALGATTISNTEHHTHEPVLVADRTPITKISTETKTVIETETIPFTTTIVDNPDWDFDHEETQQTGANGTMTRTYTVETYFGEEVARHLADETIIQPQPQIVMRGTKPKYMETPQGTFAYRNALHVWTTSYDGNCAGCSGRTATGTPVSHGTCAVDPRVIPLGTQFYVPGYGVCTAADTGGAIKGNKVDLGFEDVKFGWWSARWATIYLP